MKTRFKKINKLVVFDLDNTLTKGNSWARLNIGLGMTQEEDINFSKKYYQTQKFIEWVDKIMNVYSKRSMPTRKNIIKILSVFEYVEGAEECIKKIKKMGYEIAVISGAPNIFIELICKKLNINHFRSINTLVFNENDVLVNIVTGGEEKRAKLKYYKDICKLVNVGVKQAIIVGDGDNEELLFSASKHSLTFKNSKLKNKAWKIINSLKDLPKVLGGICG